MIGQYIEKGTGRRMEIWQDWWRTGYSPPKVHRPETGLSRLAGR